VFFGFGRRWCDFAFVGARNVIVDFVCRFALLDFRFFLFGSREV